MNDKRRLIIGDQKSKFGACPFFWLNINLTECVVFHCGN